jgi:3-oxoacyl-[acyl-carrier protein] reductase
MRVVVDGNAGVARALESMVEVVTEFTGTFDALVHVPELRVASPPRALADLDDGEWDRGGEAVLRAALHACRRAYPVLRGRGGGRIVLVIPTVTLVGAAGYAPFVMACEGIRTLAKTAARQWGSAGITVNCVAPSLAVFGVDDDGDGAVAPALGRTPCVDDLARVIAALLGEAGGVVTGATIPVDGGVVMP